MSLLRFPSSLPWPAPALLTWTTGWVAWWALGTRGLPPDWALAGGCATSLAAAWACRGGLRRAIAAAGFPLSALLLGGAAGMPPWVWLLLLLPLLAAYPLRAWRDAPFFPTPGGALQGLDAVVGEPRHVLDAGCGLGHGLAELRRLWPRTELLGVEWSLPLVALAAMRAAGLRAHVRRGDIWATSWRGHDLVYLFQRPESMARAWVQAQREMAPGSWIVSLEFAVPEIQPWACLRGEGRRPVWVYRLPAAITDPDSISTGTGR